MQYHTNPAQEAAIQATEGHVIIVSCPGSGKTTTLIRRIRHMIEKGVDPKTILMVTFTRAAARSMQDKYVELFKEQPGVIFKTIHSLCYAVLLREGIIDRDSVLADDVQRNFFVEYFKSKRYGDAFDMAENALTAITDVKNNSLEVASYKPTGLKAEIFRAVYQAYEEWKRQQHKIDYDDMLILTHRLFQEHKEVLKKYQKQFRYIQVDEYQDVNYIQKDILYALSEGSGNLCVVGDDDQSIYAFRGARPNIMLNFQKDFPDAKVIFMETNYRSGFGVVHFADKVIHNNKERFQKKFVSQRGREGFHGEVRIKRFTTNMDQRNFLIKEIQRLHEDYDTPYNEMAILFRTNEQAQMPVNALASLGIPYECTEVVRTMYESFIFNDIRAYVHLSMGVGTEDELIQILNHPTRYFKEAKFRGAAYGERSLKNHAYYIYQEGQAWQYRNACEKIEQWMEAFGPGEITPETPTAEVMRRMNGGLHSIGYDEYLRNYADYRNMDYEEIRAQYDLLLEDALLYDSIGEWLEAAEKTIRKMKDMSWQRDPEGVRISTMHKAKGLEWKVVFIVDADEFITPHRKAVKSGDPAAMEEERRLFYVAMTRAKDQVYILGSGVRSRFIKEILDGEKINRKK